jgi:hypothetical protein
MEAVLKILNKIENPLIFLSRDSSVPDRCLTRTICFLPPEGLAF